MNISNVKPEQKKKKKKKKKDLLCSHLEGAQNEYVFHPKTEYLRTAEETPKHENLRIF